MTPKLWSSFWFFDNFAPNTVGQLRPKVLAIRAELSLPIAYIGGRSYRFTTISFFSSSGKRIGCVPTHQILEEIVQIIGEDSVHAFWEFHENAVYCQLELLTLGNYRAIGVYPSMIKLCKKLKDFPVEYYFYYKAIIYYCNALFWKGKHSVKSQIEAQDAYRKALPWVFSKNPPTTLPQVSETQEIHFADYKDAKMKINYYGRKLTEASKSDPGIKCLLDPGIKCLLSKRDEERIDFLKTVEKTGGHHKPPAICPICRKFIEQVTRFPSSCGSEECKRLYDAIRKARQRGLLSRSSLKDSISKQGNGISCTRCHQKKRVLYHPDDICFACIRNTQ